MSQTVTNRPRVYVASRASIPERAAMWRQFRAEGAAILSTWIDEDGEGETAFFDELWSRIEREIRAADRLVLYVEKQDFPLKGALVEAGMAFAMGKPVFIAAPDVPIDPRNMRPVGSWAAHPLVRFVGDVRSAVFDWQVPVLESPTSRVAANVNRVPGGADNKAACDGGTCGVGGYCGDCPFLRARPESLTLAAG
jgi:hypothetical protein